MESNINLIEIILESSPIVKIVIVILLGMSILAWGVVFSKRLQIRKAAKIAKKFQVDFDKSNDLTQLYNSLDKKNEGITKLFKSGYQEFVRLRKRGVSDTNELLAGTQRVIKIAFVKEQDRLDDQLSILATIGSSAPYIGLFGTVWGVMHAFSSLGSLQHASLAAVAPGISEALVATAIGLFAAIPAVIAYNSLSQRVDRVLNHYEIFAEGFLTIIQRQAYLLPKI